MKTIYVAVIMNREGVEFSRDFFSTKENGDEFIEKLREFKGDIKIATYKIDLDLEFDQRKYLYI